MILDGKKVAAEKRAKMRELLAELRTKGLRMPKLAIVIVGHNPASETYVANKMKACAEVGIEAEKIAFEADITEQQLLEEIQTLNRDETIDGFIVQLPLPRHISEANVLTAIDFRKDVDGLTPMSIGRSVQGLPAIPSATPAGIRTLLEYYHIPTEGKHVVIIGRSNIVGKPMAIMMSAASQGNATVTVCHRKTQDLASICRTADIIIVAAGCPKLVTAEMVRPGATVIDVGINRIDDPSSPRGYRLVGDVDFENVEKVAGAISPVPGGVGPMTIVSLLQNVLRVYEHTR